MSFIDQKEIFEKTDGGRLVIEMWYPDSIQSFANPLRKFKARDKDKTASASLKLIDGVWIVTDFGGDSKSRNCITIVMLEENLGTDPAAFRQAIQIIAQKFDIIPEDQKFDIFRPEIRKREAEPDEEDGKWYFEIKDFSMVEVTGIIAPKVWDYLMKQVGGQLATDKKEPIEQVMDEVVRVFKSYNFYSLESYRIVKNRQVTEIASTAEYPIFMFDEQTAEKKRWCKIYQPKNMDAGKRFMHYGGRPTDFMFGYRQADKAFKELQAVDLDDDDEDMDAKPEKGNEKKKKRKTKLDKIIMASGGSDALNLACIGQCFKSGKEPDQLAAKLYPVWMNSETAKLSAGQFRNLTVLADKVYNLPDIDITGRREAHRLAMDHLELHTLYLPAELREKRDILRNKPCKDIRDYFRFWTPWDFEKLFKTAYPYRFWDIQPRYNKQGEFQGMGYLVNNKYMLNFLSRNGFYRYAADSEKDMYFYIHIKDNVVQRVDPKKIRDHVNDFIERRMPEVELMNTFLRSTQMNESSLSNLPFVEIDFNDFDRDTQWFFFANKSIKVTEDGIEEFRPAETDKYVWDDEVIKHRYELLPDYFTITQDPETGEHDIEIHNQDCLVLRYLINASRIFWREELEVRIDGVPEKDQEDYAASHNLTNEERRLMDGVLKADQDAYREKHKWDIAGPLLTAAEQREQKQQLINKLFVLGYNMHRYKSPSKAWATWSMDAKLSDGDESHGGTGKSLLPTLLTSYNLIRYVPLAGRNVKLTDNQHIYEGITEHTDMVFVDDAHKYLKFDFFFQAVTGSLQVNPKNAKQYSIPFDRSPKLWFTSNFPPANVDPSIERRIVYTINSDYYHHKSMDDYREERKVSDDFGKDLCRDFDEHEWNLFLNLITQCTHLYMTTERKINPPMDKVNKRNLKAGMGDAFQNWADVFFSEESGHLNYGPGDEYFVIKDEAMEDFIKNTKQNWTAKKFGTAMKAWARYYGYELNPSDVKGYKKSENGAGGRIIHKVKKQLKDGSEVPITKEMIYIRVPQRVLVEDEMPF